MVPEKQPILGVLDIAPGFVRSRWWPMLVVCAGAVVAFGLFMCLKNQTSERPEFSSAALAAIMVFMIAVMGVGVVWGWRVALRHKFILGPTLLFCTSTRWGAKSLSYGPGNALVLTQTADGRFWDLAAAQAPHHRIRVPVAAYPQLETFLTQVCPHFVSNVSAGRSP
jgi:hypothetical protein